MRTLLKTTGLWIGKNAARLLELFLLVLLAACLFGALSLALG